MLQGEHSALLLTFIKLSFVIKIFVLSIFEWPFYTGFIVVFYYMSLVLIVFQPNELVQVETYLRSEGVLVRYWYPLAMLERPPQGLRKSTITGGQILETSNVNIHR